MKSLKTPSINSDDTTLIDYLVTDPESQIGYAIKAKNPEQAVQIMNQIKEKPELEEVKKEVEEPAKPIIKSN